MRDDVADFSQNEPKWLEAGNVLEIIFMYKISALCYVYVCIKAQCGAKSTREK